MDKITTCVFDAYGTLFDVNAACRELSKKVGDKWNELSNLWRLRQLEYTWLRNSMKEYIDFWKITSDALDYAMETLNIKNIQQDSYYFLDKEDAFIHMCKVASGIDSQVLGEQEIFGQFKKAIKVAKDLMILKPNLNYFCNKAFEIVKRVRTNTGIGLNSLSVSGLSLKLVKKIFEKPQSQNILIIGAGSLAHSIVENLYNNDVSKIANIAVPIETEKIIVV